MIRKQAKVNADQIISLNHVNDLPLTNMAKRIATAMLKTHGYYACIIGKNKMFFEFKK